MDTLAASGLIEQGSYALILALLIVAGIGVPIPEDIVLLTAGALIYRGTTGLMPTAATCFVGVLGGDLLLFMTARRLGAAAMQRPLFRKLLPEGRRQRLETLFDRWGGRIVFVARHLAGIRAPMFALAGMHGMRPALFLLWDALALLSSGSIMLTLGYAFADRLDKALAGVARVEHFVLLAAVAGVAVYGLVVMTRRLRRAATRQDG